MYKQILLAFDGSDFGMGSVPYTMDLAKATGASVSAVMVSTPYTAIAPNTMSAYISEEQFNENTRAYAVAALKKVEAIASAAGVPFKAFHVRHVHPWEAIINTAKEQACDLILMASHGRRGISGVLLGSETKKVLTHTTIPVLVWRGA